MATRIWNRTLLVLLGVVLSWAGTHHVASAAQVLVADRNSNSVYSYLPDGTFLGTVLTDHTNLVGPVGLQLSPDRTHLYVASSQNNQVVRYDYDQMAATATNPQVFATVTEGLAFPNSIEFSPDENTIYISNLGGTGVSRFNLDGTSAGAPLNGTIAGGSIVFYSGLDFTDGGELIVGGFQNGAGTMGAIAKSNATLDGLEDFIPASALLNGVGQILVLGDDLYITAGFAGRVEKYNLSTGLPDPGFTPITGLLFPASIAAAPDGNGILVGQLGSDDNPLGGVDRYAFDGTFQETFAVAQANTALGFAEATAMVVAVPEPSSLVLAGVGVALLGVVARRRRGLRG